MGDNMLKEILSSEHEYRYSDYVSTPGEMGMSGEGSIGALEHNIAGLIAYVEVLTTGYGEGSKTGKPLGNKYFLKTGTKCTNAENNKIVDRSIYINNIPTGDIKLLGGNIGLNLAGAEFKGLMPGVLESMGDINPFDMLSAFTETEAPLCQAVTLPVGKSGERGIDPPNCSIAENCETEYLTQQDINNLDIHNFPGKKRPNLIKPNNEKKVEGFTNYYDINDINKHGKKGHKLKDDHLFLKIYYSALGLMMVYVFFKLLNKNR